MSVMLSQSMPLLISIVIEIVFLCNISFNVDLHFQLLFHQINLFYVTKHSRNYKQTCLIQKRIILHTQSLKI